MIFSFVEVIKYQISGGIVLGVQMPLVEWVKKTY